ncbi:DUF6886 family protein [Streptomyces sp. NPDC001530]|uniref:DUF6886 family protein n=1 Tax=Streptomyces sp. NPDC001530 TaxID=3364582 RepID=UPI003679D494
MEHSLGGVIYPSRDSRLPAAPCRPFGEPVPHAFVATEPVGPFGAAQPVGDFLRLHRDAGIPMRVLDNL